MFAYLLLQVGVEELEVPQVEPSADIPYSVEVVGVRAPGTLRVE